MKQIYKHRVITMLDRKEMDFLDKLGKDSLFSTGRKLSYNEILKALVDFAMEAGINAEKVDSFATLKEKLKEYLPQLVLAGKFLAAHNATGQRKEAKNETHTQKDA